MKRFVSVGCPTSVVIAFLALILGCKTVAAHGVDAVAAGPGKVRFTYADGNPVASGYVQVRNTAGKEIATGQADRDGVFDYSGYVDVGTVSIADVHGHHRDHAVGTAERSRDTVGTTLGVVIALSAVAAGVYAWNNRRRPSGDAAPR